MKNELIKKILKNDIKDIMKFDNKFKNYMYNQILFILSISFIFFILYYFNYSIVEAGFIVWVILIQGVYFLYLDLKFMNKINNIDKEIVDLKYIIKNLNEINYKHKKLK